MSNIDMGNVTFKQTRKAKKRGYLEVKYRIYTRHPLTQKRWEIVSKWYLTSESYSDSGKIKISPQLQGIIRKELQEKLNQFYQKFTLSTIRYNEDITLNSIWNEWEKDRIEKKKVAPKTLAGEQGRYKNHILKYLPPDSLLQNITSDVIQKMIDQFYPLGNHKRIAQAVKSDLSSIYSFAIKRNYIKPEQNPMTYVQIENKGLEERIKELESKNIEDSYLEKDELVEVLAIVNEHNRQYGRIFEFQSLTGMRIGEVLGLKISDIDFQKRIAYVKRTRATHAGARKNKYEGSVKNEQSYRNVELSQKALELLKEEIEENDHHIAGNPNYQDNNWIFTSKNHYKAMYNGIPLHYSVLNNFQTLVKQARKQRQDISKMLG